MNTALKTKQFGNIACSFVDSRKTKPLIYLRRYTPRKICCILISILPLGVYCIGLIKIDYEILLLTDPSFSVTTTRP